MNTQEAKKELVGYRNSKLYIDTKKQNIRQLESKLEGAAKDYNQNGIQKSKSNYVEELLTKLIDLKIEQLQFLADAERVKVDIERKINQLDQPYRNILYFKYILDWSMTKIAFKLDYEYKWLSKLHVKALEAYGQINIQNATQHDKKMK